MVSLRKMSEGLFRSSRKIAKRREFSAENSAAMNYSRLGQSYFFFGRLSALAKSYSFAIFGLSVGWCELQM
jgi:hypothetical protein